ncbi:hypothetical protein [Butyrivibrio sp. TB]|uniref:hypothetical protein n=1 Tax=Butyrivibrio sp. TB TaxID=1520809 RepID=UPI0008C94048|nr:hypothetical protein [Butyrivibrio sp. TB]SEP55818.1 hypothetical protein SAMN02910382_00268 [Butyrivibrio sp. TB]
MTTTKIRSFQPNGYQETIKKGLSAIHSFNSGMSLGKDDDTEQLDRLKEEIKTADAIVIGAGAGLSTSAGFTYSGDRFKKWFSDFEEKYGFQDMYSGGFYPYKTKEELNYKEAYCPREIEDRSVCINSDIDELLDKLA